MPPPAVTASSCLSGRAAKFIKNPTKPQLGQFQPSRLKAGAGCNSRVLFAESRKSRLVRDLPPTVPEERCATDSRLDYDQVTRTKALSIT